MAIDHRIGSKVMKSARREEASATRVDPYPYIGIVKNNLDPTRSGRLQVFIPDLGGPPDDPNNWRTVSYASPYQGYTSQVENSIVRPSQDNKFNTVSHTYGLWMVPPDVGIQVIVIFIAGDPLRGFWIACVNPKLSHYMIPALGGTPNIDRTTLGGTEKTVIKEGDAAPVVEFNEFLTQGFTSPSFYLYNKPVHSTQFGILLNQGLEKDRVRGVISSSSQRESPSHVFGISTPGRPIDDPADDTTFLQKLQSNQLDAKYQFTKTRKGGHTFVMDDGALMGEDKLVRLRTSGGHQILMHDTNNTFYIAHANGNTWVELTPAGQVHVYSKGGINFRTEGKINIHCDDDLKINSKGSVHIKALKDFKLEASNIDILASADKFRVTAQSNMEFKAGSFQVDSGAVVSIQAGGVIALQGSKINQNSGGTKTLKAIEPFKVNKLYETQKNGEVWTAVASKLETIVTVAPTHEPYFRGEQAVVFTPSSPGIQPGPTYSGSVDATQSPEVTQGQVQNPAGDKELRDQPPCNCTVANLTPDQMTAYFTQIGKSESGGKYDVVNRIGFAGKYQFGYPALIDGGYVKRHVGSNSQLKNPNSWTGKNGIESLEDWLANGPEQEAAMCEYTKRNYRTMCRIGAVTEDQSPEDVAGMLAVAHLLGPGGAKDFRNGKSGADAFGTTGATYFNKGKYAVAVLAPKLSEVNAG